MKSSAKYWVILARSNLTAIDTMISVRNVACWPVKQPDRASRVGLASVRDDNRSRTADLKETIFSELRNEVVVDQE